MGRMSLFNSPLLLGFEHFERTLDRANRAASDGYPPYNIEKVAEDALRITLAVAGFARDDLSIVLEENQLVIRGRQAKDDDRVYVHRGIAARQFQRAFVLADGIEVEGAELENGLLHVDLVRPQPATVARSIEIKSATDIPDGSSGSGIAVDVTGETESSASMTDESVD
ncbi:MAG: heat-shock protein Hsp20 [Alphaproteobacteria bacterium]|nr:heat-shock protein Hsp20 [Alphaproteobacteria bacterium]|tara:strand:- start:1570 stop:2076 length:507 start_codon:yes stop_codon:yes gene_type:complete